MKLYLDYKLTGKDSLNAIYSGRHWSSRKKYKNDITTLVYVSMQQQKIKPAILAHPAEIRFTYPKDNLDIDNHAYFAKCVIDALKGVIIQDDNPRWVKGISQRFGKNQDRITVEVTEEQRHSCHSRYRKGK